MWTNVNGVAVHISGSFTDKDNACKFCKYFNIFGVSTGYCVEHNEEMCCNDTCEKFDKDTEI